MPVENCFKNTHLNEFNSQKFFVSIFHKLPPFLDYFMDHIKHKMAMYQNKTKT